MRRRFSIVVLLFIFMSTGTLFQNCSAPSDNQIPSTNGNGGNTNTDNNSGGVYVSGGDTFSRDDGGSTDNSSSGTSNSPSASTVAADDAYVVTPVVGTELNVHITFATNHIGLTGAIFVAAYYSNTWYFWDPHTAGHWVAMNMDSANTFPEFATGNAPSSMNIKITDILTDAHGAQIYIGAGYGSDAVSRKNSLTSSNNYKYIHTVP